MEKAEWTYLLIEYFGWKVRYLIELTRDSGKVHFGIYSVLTDKESVMQLLCSYLNVLPSVNNRWL